VRPGRGIGTRRPESSVGGEDLAAVPSIDRAGSVGGAAPFEADLTRSLYEEYAHQIFRYCLHQLGSREEAEDAVQSTFLNAFRGLKRGVVPELESAWLFKIAHNVCLSRRRSSWRRGRIESPADFELVEELTPAPVRRADELIGLQDVLEQLPESQRRAILLREWQGLSYREIAEELDLSQAAVETLIFRARRALASGLERPPERQRKHVARAVDWGNIATAVKSLLVGGSAAAKVAATVAVVSATTVVAAQPVEQHLRKHHAVPAPPPTHVARTKAPPPARVAQTVVRTTPVAVAPAPKPQPAHRRRHARHVAHHVRPAPLTATAPTVAPDPVIQPVPQPAPAAPAPAAPPSPAPADQQPQPVQASPGAGDGQTKDHGSWANGGGTPEQPQRTTQAEQTHGQAQAQRWQPQTQTGATPADGTEAQSPQGAAVGHWGSGNGWWHGRHDGTAASSTPQPAATTVATPAVQVPTPTLPTPTLPTPTVPTPTVPTPTAPTPTVQTPTPPAVTTPALPPSAQDAGRAWHGHSGSG
jgi:RNA polymerase sigma factor (sigma-70 family)